MAPSLYLQRLLKRSTDGNTLFVFPSEVVAQSWQRAFVTTADGPKAIRTDRLISWDRFKERAISVKRDARPASREARMVFAHTIVEENSRAPFLRGMIDPRFAREKPNVAGGLTRLLPQLPILDTESHRLRDAMAADIGEIYGRYRAFLGDHHLFEPNWELRNQVRLDGLPGKPVIFWPELLEDYGEYREILDPYVEVEPLPQGTPAETKVFETSRDETGALFDAIENDLAAGTEAHEIAVTVSDIDGMRPWLTEGARRRDIPLRYADGQPVSNQPGGTIFQRLDEVGRDNYDVRAIASLLLDRAVPWKNETENYRLIQFGYETHCYNRAQWYEAFDIIGEAPGGNGVSRFGSVMRHFRAIERDVRDILRASTSVELRRAYRRFADHHIAPPGSPRWADDSRWKVERVYSTALRLMERMEGLESLGLTVPVPWRFFLTLLSEEQYVLPHETEGVTVYPYRVAAGTPTQRHYVIGLSQGTTRVRRMPPIGLRSDEAAQLFGPHADRSAAFLAAYGGAMGNTVCSCSLDTPTGRHVPAPELPWPREASRPVTDLWERERRWWGHGEEPAPQTLYPRQAAGLSRALSTTLSPVTSDFRSVAVFPELIPLLRIPSEWSPKTIDLFNQCPYSFFLRHALGVETGRVWGYTPGNPRVLGNLLHAVLRSAASQPDGALDSRSIAGIVEEQFNSLEGRLYLPRIGAKGRIHYFTSAINALLENELLNAKRQDDHHHHLEFRIAEEVDGVAMTGTADRIISSPEGDTIIDYKTRLGAVHAASKVLPEDVENLRSATTLQLPIYALLYRRHSGRDVSRLVYVDITAANVKVIADRHGNKRNADGWSRMEEVVERLPAYLGRVVNAVAEGRMQCDEEPDCSSCRVKGMCRSCFITRRFTDGT